MFFKLRRKLKTFLSCFLFSRCCHNNKAGQELCYLCHQRSRKNIPIYLAEEKRRREQEDDKCLTQYQHSKDLHAVLREQVSLS